MPEIAEVARVVHYLRKHVVGRTIAAVKVQEDDIVYGKVGTSAGAFQAAMTGGKVVDARQQGKYFWLEMAKPPHPLMHLGMTGWVRFSNDDTSYYKPVKKEEEEEWPPRFWKFVLEMEGKEECKVAFVDARRLARVRLVDVEADMMRKTTPLKENGPDPIVDRDVLTVDWLTKKLRSKRVSIKALLLDQANISGVGNWVGDEVLFQARIHPEQYSYTLSDAQIKTLHEKLMEVCTIACDNLADSSKFPDSWIMTHRWGKGKKESSTLPTGEKIVFLTVGGRTSAMVPSLQKKTAIVAGDVSVSQRDDNDGNAVSGAEEEEKSKKPRNGRKHNAIVRDGHASNGDAAILAKRTRRTAVVSYVDEDPADEDEEIAPLKKPKGCNTKKKDVAEAPLPKKLGGSEVKKDVGVRRRSTRNSSG